jgi:hypothetical protein
MMDDTSEIEDKEIDIAFNAQTNKEPEGSILSNNKNTEEEVKKEIK